MGRLPVIARSVALVLACGALGALRQAPFHPDALWDPAAGLDLFFLMRMGAGAWPAVLAANLALIVLGSGLSVKSVLIAGAMTAAYTAVAIALGGRRSWDTVRSLLAIVRVVLPGTLALCASVAALLVWSGEVPASDAAPTVLHDWIAELDGVLVVMPALMVFFESPPWRWRPDLAALLEAIGQFAAIAIVVWAVFAIASTYNVRFFSLLFLPLVWIVARWGLPGACLALVAFQAGIVVLAHMALTSVVQIQVLTLALCATGLTLGTVVTQRKRMESSLEEKQAALNRALQLASIGETTSALAHEMSQPVAALSRYLGACEMMALEGNDAALLRETMRKATAEAARATEVVRRLRDFYRRGAAEIANVAPMRLIGSALKSTLTRIEQAGVGVTARALEPLPDVAVDALQVETALLNVLNNAVDALADWPERREITITAARVPAGVAITFRDTGPGIDPQVAARLFEPFNTSKASGMGMGLAIARSLLASSGGRIALEAGASRGATFVVTLPAHAPPPGAP